jgi:hypothetical protein
MKHVFIIVAGISGLLLFGTPGFAQEHDLNRIFQKVQYDVNNIQSVKSLFSEEDRYSLSKTNRDLDELQRDYAACQCNQQPIGQPAFSDVVYTLQSALSDHRVTGRDREVLQEDLHLLRGTSYADTQAYAR